MGMKRWMPWASVLVLVWGLWGCASTGGMARGDRTPGASQYQEPDVFPGGWGTYNWGIGQSVENFGNVAQMQFLLDTHTTQRFWAPVRTGGAPSATIIGIGTYWPLSVRWKLKDGREYILENIDMRTIMREYFKTNRIELQWQKERRPKADLGDYVPTLVHQVKDDMVLIEWVITTNSTPVKDRVLPNGAATLWSLTKERYLVTTLKGHPTSGLDFSKTRVLLSPASIVHP
jgi:hypothetical protein